MATRKPKAAPKKESTVSTTATPPSARIRRRARARVASAISGSTRRAGKPAIDLNRYVTPGVAALASTAIAAIGYVFRDQIGDTANDTLRSATKSGRHAYNATREQAMHAVDAVANELSWDTLLRHAGLQRRSMVTAVVGPAIGVACGIVAGSALTFFYGPKLLDHFSEKKGVASRDASAVGESAVQESQPPSEGTTERARPNGGMHGRAS
jgi:hypothetical protein